MILDDASHQALKEFLTKELVPICDADPGMLADYIIALLKHDKPLSELKALCNSQLEDFLSDKTAPFVDTLFDALETNSYLATAPEEESIPTGPAAESNSRTSGQEKHLRGESDGSDDEDRSYKHARRGGDHDRDSHPRHREYSPSRSTTDDDRHGARSGSRPNEQGISTRSEYERRDRSNMPSRQGITTDRYNNSNNHHQQAGFNNNIKGPNGRTDRGQWNGPSNPRDQFNGRPRGNFGNDNGHWQGGASMRGGRGGQLSGQGMGQDRPRRQRCRDYDEKGFCMRGDNCPYDHGEDRIVVDEMHRGPFDMMGGHPNLGPILPPFFMGGPNGGPMPNPEIFGAEGAGLPNNEMGHPRLGHDNFERNQGGSDASRYSQDSSNRGMRGGRGSLRGVRGGRGRGGSSHPYSVPGRFGNGSTGAGSRTSLVVENIPDEFNTIDKVNEFFKQFGSLTNIQVDQPAHKALIQYSSRDEANAAYNSPEVIFGNRFVKVYWQPEDLNSSTFGQPKPTGQVRPDMNGAASASAHKPPATSVLMTPERAAELAAERAASAAKLLERQKTMQEIQRQKEALIQRQQEEQKLLLQKMFANKNMSQEDKDEILKGLKNVAIEVTKETVNPLEKAKAAAVAAEALKQADYQKQAERLEKARLDRELESLNSNSETGDASATTATGAAPTAAETTAALKAKLASLQAQAAALGLENQGGYAGRGRGGFIPRGRGRGAPNTWTRGGARGGAIVSQHRTFRLDNRSSKVSVQNLDDVSRAGLKAHLETFGELENFAVSEDGSSASVQFKNRKDAEMALQQGSQIPDAAPLKLGWISEPAPSASTFTPSSTTTYSSTAPLRAETSAVEVADAASFHVESEDEDNERSWKR